MTVEQPLVPPLGQAGLAESQAPVLATLRRPGRSAEGRHIHAAPGTTARSARWAKRAVRKPKPGIGDQEPGDDVSGQSPPVSADGRSQQAHEEEGPRSACQPLIFNYRMAEPDYSRPISDQGRSPCPTASAPTVECAQATAGRIHTRYPSLPPAKSHSHEVTGPANRSAT